MRVWSVLMHPWWFLILAEISLEGLGRHANGQESLEDSQSDTGRDTGRKAELTAADRALEDFGRQANRVGRLATELESVIQEIQQLDLLHAELVAQTQDLESLVRHVNAVQIYGLLQQLDEIQYHEVERRQKNVESQQLLSSIDLSNTVTRTDLERRLRSSEILNETQVHLEQWIMDLAKDVINNKSQEMVVPQNVVQCVKPSEAVHVVQESLVAYLQDGIGKVDHAQGATIVYELTSNTYNPPPDSNDMFGNAWWRRYIPSEWEQFLPKGWKNRNARLPSYLYHSLGMRGRVWSPKAILNHDVLPGSCWPMEGTAGQVTFVLPYPVRITALTVDHASSMLLPPEQRSSAPRRIRVVGFPPCRSTECAGIGFQADRRIPLIEFDYDIKGSSTQTFEVEQATSSAASCSQETESCGSPDSDDIFSVATTQPVAVVSERDDDIPILAVAVEILNNWGNNDYTCVYRIRVHGDALS